MKISYLLGGLDSTGGSLVLYNFMDTLTKNGHEVYVILPNAQIKWNVGIWREIINNKNTGNKKYGQAHLNNLIGFFGAKNKNIKNLNYFYGLKKFTEGLIKNWVHSDVTIATYCLTAYAAFYLSDKTVPLYHMQSFEELFFKDKTQRLIARNTYKLPLIKVSNSKWLQNIILKKFNDESILINPGIDLTIFRAHKNIENKYKTKKEWLIVSYFNETPMKGFYDAVKAVKLARNHLQNEGINIKWKVFGLKPPSKTYDTQVEYVGKIFGDDLAKLYSQADIVLMPSWYESFPLPPIEAMACGSLIITTRYGTEDYVFNNENGLVCLPRKPEEMAQNIIYAIKNPDESLKMVKEALSTVRAYSWEERTDIFEKILEEAIENYPIDQFRPFDDLVDGNFKESTYKEFDFE